MYHRGTIFVLLSLGVGEVGSAETWAFLATSQYIENSFIVGQLPLGGIADEWGVVLAKDSPLTASVSEAIDELRADGTLQQITDQWLDAEQGVPILQ